jgi:spoIIIJ-associated protein
MNERTTLEVIAPTVDEAIARGLADLGLAQDAVDVEILDPGSRGLLGIGSRQVRVRLTIKSAGTLLSAEGTPAPAGGDLLLDTARSTVVELLDKMRIPASVEVRYGTADDEGNLPVLVDIHGNDLGVLIGRRAEILNAMQYLVNLIVSKRVEHWIQVVVDVEGYRARRERQLRQMARRMADQALKTGRRQVLEPMSASERRIIHLELRDHPEVTTQSVGEEPARKVTIVPK